MKEGRQGRGRVGVWEVPRYGGRASWSMVIASRRLLAVAAQSTCRRIQNYSRDSSEDEKRERLKFIIV